MDVIETSPWCVTNLDEFMYYNCPQCDKRDKCKNSFLKHAFNEHPESKKHLEMFAVKEELIMKQNPDNLIIDCDPFMNVHIKQEKTDEFELQGIPSQTGKSNLALREGRQDISDIL